MVGHLSSESSPKCDPDSPTEKFYACCVDRREGFRATDEVPE